MSIKDTSYMWQPLDDGTVIIDRWCQCAHKQSQHVNPPYVKEKGHGHCKECSCIQFTFKDWIRIPNPEIKHG